MAYVNKEVHEEGLLLEIANIFVEQGWELVGETTRVSVTHFGSSSPGYLETPYDETNHGKAGTFISGSVAEHIIVKPPGAEVYYGLAYHTSLFNALLSEFNEANWIGNFTELVREDEDRGLKYYKFTEGIDAFHKRIVDLSKKHRNTNRIYAYMTKERPNIKGKVTLMQPPDFSRNFVMDLEIEETLMVAGGGYDAFLEVANPNLLQSPYSIMRLRSVEEAEQTVNGYPIQNSNWHPDSIVEIKGVVEEDFAFLTIETDSGPSYNNNVTPSIPLFFGRFKALSQDDDRNYALIAGSAFKSDDPRYDFDSTTPFDGGIPPMPTLKKYPNTPANGIDNVMVFRTKGGAYYQSHHLFVEVDPNGMPPKREFDGRKYPSAWQQADADPYDYQMNPSRYSGEVHASRIYIAHMDEGVRGYLDGIIGLNPISLLDGDTLKVKVAWCEEGYDEYEYKVLSSVSPFTKYPSTPFRPLGLGIIKNRHREGE